MKSAVLVATTAVLAALVLPGYRVDGLVAGILGALVMTVANWVLGAIFKKDKD